MDRAANKDRTLEERTYSLELSPRSKIKKKSCRARCSLPTLSPSLVLQKLEHLSRRHAL